MRHLLTVCPVVLKGHFLTFVYNQELLLLLVQLFPGTDVGSHILYSGWYFLYDTTKL